jgi:type IV secretory pathway VirJ component
MTTALKDEVTVGLMRHQSGHASRYAMEYLFVRLIQHYRDQGYRSFSLGTVPLSGFHTPRPTLRWHRLGRMMWLLGQVFYNFQGLRTFKGKFAPTWEPRYLAASGWLGRYFALVDIAALIGVGIRAGIGRPGAAVSGRRRTAAALAITAAGTFLTSLPARALDTGNLGEVHQVNPAGVMRGFVVLFSDAGGWTTTSDDLAAALARDGALVVGVDLPAYLRRLDAHPSEECHELVGNIESISRQIQRERGNASYLSPIVAGVGEGGTLAAAILAQAPVATIAGAVAYNPTADVRTHVPLCSTPAAKADPEGGFIYGPWRLLPGFWVAGFASGHDTPGHQRTADLRAAGTPVAIENLAGDDAAEAFATLLRPHLSPAAIAPSAGIANLPLVELPAEPRGPLLAIVFSGDGGWRDLDKTIAEKLQSDGVSTIGWDSLRYFWRQKSPEQTARDLDAVIDTYALRWGASKVALIGYSFGADVLPFAYDRLSPAAKARVVQLSLLGFATAADFQISVAGWLGAAPGKGALPTEPALAPINPTMIQCFYGSDEDDSACPSLARKGTVEVIRTGGGHHFDGDYSRLAQRVLDGFRRRAD